MDVSPKLNEYGSAAWARRRESLGPLGREADRLLSSLNGEEAALLRVVLATLPLSDLGDHPLSLFRQGVREAMELREEFAWCAALPEHLFVKEVLYPRVNNEELSPCRPMFASALRERVKGKSLTEAILAVNRWCGEQVTYRSTDDRTSSALEVYRRGYGRCGEESTFAVNALRSVGIAARQVYAPWWSHCGDNHAWVEAYDGKVWRYLGACEPEPELDRGWFTGASSRAMMIHARAFVQGSLEEAAFLFPETALEDLSLENGVALEAVTHRYGEVKTVTVTVRDENGMPVPNLPVRFYVLNMGFPREIACRRTNDKGEAVIRLGLGSVWIGAGESDRLTLFDDSRGELFLRDKGDGENRWKEILFCAPQEKEKRLSALTPEQGEERRRTLEHCAACRERRKALEVRPVSPKARRILSTLTEKDRAGEVPAEILEDSEDAFRWEENFPKEVFEQALLCPRIGHEPLRPWRRELAAFFPEEEKTAFQKDPRKIWDWLEKNIRKTSQDPTLWGSLGGTLRLGAGDGNARAALFCGFCRALGIPARISPETGIPEYWAEGSYCLLEGSRQEKGQRTAMVSFSASPERELREGRDFALCKAESHRFRQINVGDLSPGERRRISLLPGEYRLTTTLRLPGGDQLARSLSFSLGGVGQGERGNALELGELALPRCGVEQLLVRFTPPPFRLWSREGVSKDSACFCGDGPFPLFLWLEPGREPTEHILNELWEEALSLGALKDKCRICFVLEDPEGERDPALHRVLKALPEAEVWSCDFSETTPPLSRSVYADPDLLPLVMLLDREGICRYAQSGYRVGAAGEILQVLKTLIT